MADSGVERTLGRILATQELILKQLEVYAERLEDHIRDDYRLGKRIDRIESRMAWVAGIATAAVGFWSVTSDLILTKIGLR